jgi:hypothetical protein
MTNEDMEKAYLLLSKTHTDTMLELIQTREMLDVMSSGWLKMLIHRIKWRFNIDSRFHTGKKND